MSAGNLKRWASEWGDPVMRLFQASVLSSWLEALAVFRGKVDHVGRGAKESEWPAPVAEAVAAALSFLSGGLAPQTGTNEAV